MGSLGWGGDCAAIRVSRTLLLAWRHPPRPGIGAPASLGAGTAWTFQNFHFMLSHSRLTREPESCLATGAWFRPRPR